MQWDPLRQKGDKVAGYNYNIDHEKTVEHVTKGSFYQLIVVDIVRIVGRLFYNNAISYVT